MKICGGCGRAQIHSEFYRRATNGLQARCKSCQRTQQKRYYLENAKTKKVIPTTKQCSHCKQIKERVAFTFSRSSRDGLDYLCRRCKADRAKVRVKKCSRASNLWAKYRLTPEAYDLLLCKQENACAICKKGFGDVKKQHPYVDHSHLTNVVRGILCPRCNCLLSGLESHNGDFLPRALEYLRQHGEPLRIT